MANERDLNIFRQGAEVWNKWIGSFHATSPDLSEVNLEGENLYGLNLNHTNLSGAHLQSADLRKSNLYRATLRDANLCSAKLSEANLTGADLRGADLRGAELIGTDAQADFRKADLTKADMLEANLSVADLRGATLVNACLNRADLRMAKLQDANLYQANLALANLSDAELDGANLRETNLFRANLSGARLRNAKLQDAELQDADLYEADMSGADLSGAILYRARLVGTNLEQSNLTNCRIHGASAWGLRLEGAVQKNLIISAFDESTITVDDLELGQFIYLLLNNNKIRDVINLIGNKGVLILGRFTERKYVVDEIRKKVRQLGYVPLVFDFERPTDRDFTETVMTLAGMSLFIIADITKPRSVPLELQATIPNYMIPFVPILQKGEEPFAMFADLQHKYKWVLPLVKYSTVETLLDVFDETVKVPALTKRSELMSQKASGIVTVDVDELRKRKLKD